MDFLKKSVLWVVLVITVALWGYVETIKKAPCEAPLQYTLGTFDKRFGISKTDFLREVADATHIWENSIGKDLFENSSEAKPLADYQKFLQQYIGKYFTRQPIVINLIYDARQKTADQKRAQVSAIDETKQSADEIKKQFLALQSEYERAKAEYERLLSEYKQRRGDFNGLEAKRLEVNGLAEQSNALIHKYNFLVKSINSTIQTINQSVGQEFEEGQYVSDASGEEIDIYEFGNRDILERVLAHELGHVLGLDHNNNQNSIMYYLNSSKNIVPTKEDVEALKGVCSIAH